MPAPLAKGIIITLTLLTALGGALLANPQVRAWVDEQRRKIAEALRSLGDELDPHSRRQAEAFAYEGRIPGDRAEPSGVAPPLARRESEAARRAVARATGRDTGIELDETSRRLTRTGSDLVNSMSGKLDEEDEAERRRLGREYLARRNAEMLEAKEKAKMRKSAASLSSPPAEASDAANSADIATPVTIEGKGASSSSALSAQHLETANPWNFDNLVDENGSLKSPILEQEMEKTLELPSPPTTEPKSLFDRKIAIAENVQPEPAITLPIRQASAFDTGSRWANPFGDEFEVEESGTGWATPKASHQPPVIPPKIALDQDPEISVPNPEEITEEKLPEVETREDTSVHDEAPRLGQDIRHDGSPPSEYDEDLAIALSLSSAEEEKRQKAIQAQLVQDYDADIAAAIAASLAEPEQQHRNILSAQQMVQRRNEAANERMQRLLKAGMTKKDAKISAASEKIAEKMSDLTSKNVQTETLVDVSTGSDPPVSIPQEAMQSTRSTEEADELDSLYDASPELKASTASRLASPFHLPPSERLQHSDAQQPSVFNPSSSSAAVPREPPPTYNTMTKPRGDILIEIDDTPEEEEKPINLFQDAAKRRSLGLPPYQDHPSFSSGIEDQDRQLNEGLSWIESDEFAAMLKSSRNQSEEPEKVIETGTELRDGARTPTTAATLSPSVERESIAFSSGDEDDFASANGSAAHSTANLEHASPTASFTTDSAPSAQHSDADTDSLVGHSEAESASLVDPDSDHDGQGVGIVEDDDDSSDEEWGSGIRTPGSEWTDVGSVVSEEEVGGQGERRLVRG